MSPKAAVQQLAANSALYVLEDYLARYPSAEAPRGMRIACDKIKKAKTIDELLGMEISPYKLVRDAVQDQIRVMQGLAPDSSTSRRWVKPENQPASDGINTRNMYGSATQKQMEIEPVDERFDLRAHNITHKFGSVDSSYERFTHGLGQRVDSTLDIKQANPDN